MESRGERSTIDRIWDLPERASTARWGEALGKCLRPGDVIGLIGDLGAGKTTLTQAIARGMGITSPVTSPTFTLLQEYPGPIPLFHLDPYRLERPEDLADLGLEEYFERGGVVIVEWADKVETLLPSDRLTLWLEIAEREGGDLLEEDESRRLTAIATESRSTALLEEFTNSLTGSAPLS
jgi:tRNA threonylcarbamoyladenosine biosynthesis protein TsaE